MFLVFLVDFACYDSFYTRSVDLYDIVFKWLECWLQEVKLKL